MDDVEAVFLLAVDPGWGGQKFIPSTGRRFEKLRSLIGNRNLLTGLDGGVTQDNIAEIAGLKPDIVVTGSAVFDGKTPAENLRRMLDAVRRPRAG